MIWLRSAGFNLFFFGLTILMTIGGLPLRWLAPQRLTGYARLWVRLVLGGLRLICRISWQATGLEHLPPDGPVLIASMHQSAFDTLIWVLLAPRFAYVLKRELTRIPLFGSFLRQTGMIPIDRRAGAAALRELLRAADRARAERRQVVIFPEGTRVPPGASVRLQPGVAAMAARMGVPVIPVVTDSGLCWGRRAFRKRPGVIHIRLAPPLPPDLPREVMMQRLQAIFDAAARSVDNSVGEASSRLRPSAS